MMPRRWTPRDPKEAWERICDTFPLDTPFTMRQAVLVGFPRVGDNNVTLYSHRLRALFEEVEERTAQDDEYGIPHIRCVRNRGSTPSREMWELPRGRS